MIYGLPTKLDVGGKEYEIRTDYRAVLDICTALSDPDLNDEEKMFVALGIMYSDFDSIPPVNYKEALDQCFWFINGGDETKQRKAPKLVDWEQDFKYIIAPINRVCGQDIRAILYDSETNVGGFHWWSFISAYYEIGDCLFAQIVRIRNKQARGKKLDKEEREWYRQNRELVDMRQNYSTAEKELLKEWT